MTRLLLRCLVRPCDGGLHLADVNLPDVQLLDVVERRVAASRARPARARRAVRKGVIAAVRKTRG